jgi:hypothetical protein
MRRRAATVKIGSSLLCPVDPRSKVHRDGQGEKVHIELQESVVIDGEIPQSMVSTSRSKDTDPKYKAWICRSEWTRINAKKRENEVARRTANLLEPNARYQGRGTRWDRLGKLVGVVPHSAGEHPQPLRASIGPSGASPHQVRPRGYAPRRRAVSPIRPFASSGPLPHQARLGSAC